MPPGDPLRGVAQRRLRHQAARVDGPERHAGADGGVDGGVQLRLVVDAVQPQAAGEVDQRFLLVELAQHLGGGLERGQLAVGVEDVELAVVLAEGRAGVGGAGVVWSISSKPWPSPTISVSRMLNSRSRSSVKSCSTSTAPPEYRMMATRSAGVICVRMNFCAASSARNWSAGGMAVMSKYSASRRRSLYRSFPGAFGRDLGSGRAGRRRGYSRGAGGVPQGAALGVSGSFWYSQETDGLRHAVFGDREILGGQAFDGIAVLVLDHDGLDDQLRAGVEGGRSRCLPGGAFWPICWPRQ